MYYYKIAELTVRSCYRLASFGNFACEPAEPDVTLEQTDQQPPDGEEVLSGNIVHRRLKDGWFFYTLQNPQKGSYVSADYTCLRMLGVEGPQIDKPEEWMIRIALECMLIRKGYVSLHSAAVELQGEAYAFTGPSGIGKSTRAKAWIQGLGAKLISGDRPLIRVRDLMLYGVPWDGKEQCFRNVCYPLKAICEVRRSETVYAESMNFMERRKLLMSQCFIPMWDTETALIQMENITHLAAEAEIIRVFSGSTVEDARLLYGILQQKNL